MRTIWITCLLLALCLTARAQRDTISLSEVEVVGISVDRSVGSSTPLQRLDRQQMRQLGVSSLADAVKRFAGVSVRDYGGMGGLKTISIHNLGARHTAISFDGAPLSNIQAGQIDIGRYATDELESVSMSLGSDEDLMQGARLYASAGTITMRSLKPSFRDDETTSLRAAVQGGSFGFVNPTLRLWQKISDGMLLSAHGSFTHSDGGYPYTLHNASLTSREHRSNTDLHAWQADLGLWNEFRDGSTLQTKLFWYSSQRGLPGAVILYADPSEARMWDEDFFVQTNYRRPLGRNLKFSAWLRYARAWNQYRDFGSQYPDGEQTDRDTQHEGYASATLGWTPLRGLTIALAQDLAFNKLENNVYVDMQENIPRPRRWSSWTAVSARWQTSRLTLSGNLTATYVSDHVKAGSAPQDKKRLVPALSASYRLLPRVPLYIRAMVRNTFRVPTFNDLYYRRLGNVNLRPEFAHEYSLGLTYEIRSQAVLNYLTLTADAYYNNVKDKIVAFPSTYVWRMRNFGRVDIHGIDLTLGLETQEYLRSRLSLTTSWTLQRAEDKTSRESATYGRLIPYTPRVNGQISAVLTTPWFGLGYTVMMQGRRYAGEQNKQEELMHAYWEHSLNLFRDFNLGHNKLSLSLKAQNIGNTQYEIIQYYPMPGRQFIAQLAWQF